MGDEKHKRAVSKKTAYLALGVVLTLIAAGAAWAVFGGKAADVAGVSESTSTADTTRSVDAQSDDTTLAASEATPTLMSEPEGGDLEITYDPSASPPVIEQMTGAIVSVNGSGDAYTLSIDFVEFLAGEEAVAAAKGHGGSVSDSGLYVVNDNPKVRDYPIQPGTTVRVTTNLDGTPNQLGQVLSVKDWAAGVNGAAKTAYTSGTYIVTITNGTITAIEQLYLP